MQQGRMHAILIEDYGGPEALELVQAPIPQLSEGQVLIKSRIEGHAAHGPAGHVRREFEGIGFCC